MPDTTLPCAILQDYMHSPSARADSREHLAAKLPYRRTLIYDKQYVILVLAILSFKMDFYRQCTESYEAVDTFMPERSALSSILVDIDSRVWSAVNVAMSAPCKVCHLVNHKLI